MAIKKHALNYQETKYEMAIVADAFRGLFATKQKEKESLQDYTRRFVTQKDVLESHIGALIALLKIVEKMLGYNVNDDAIIEKLSKEAHKAFMAYLYLEKADEKIYGSVLMNLHSQQSLDNDQFPRTIIAMTNVLSNHKFDKKTRLNKENRQG